MMVIKKLKSFYSYYMRHSPSPSPSLEQTRRMTTTTTRYVPETFGKRKQTFNKNTRQNYEFERYLMMEEGKVREQFLLDATRSRKVPLTYFITSRSPSSSPSSSPVRSSGRQHGKSEQMEYESYRMINLQKPGGHAHSLIMIKSKAIKENEANIGIFEPNGQSTQREFDIVDTESHNTPHSTPSPHTQSVAGGQTTPQDITHQYLSISPRKCINYGIDSYNPGYCGIFGMILIMTFRNYKSQKDTGRWLRKWKLLLEYMRQEIPDEPKTHGCLGVSLAAKVQEIIAAATPASPAAFQKAEKAIIKEIKKCIA